MLLGLLPCDTWGNFRSAEGGNGNTGTSLAGLACRFAALAPWPAAVVLLSNSLVFSCSTSLTSERTKAVAVHWKPLWSAVRRRQGKLRCWVFDKAGELCSLSALLSRGGWRKRRVMREGLAFTRGWCLSPKDGLLGAPLPVSPAFAPSWPVPHVCSATAVQGWGLCRAALSQHSPYG